MGNEELEVEYPVFSVHDEGQEVMSESTRLVVRNASRAKMAELVLLPLEQHLGSTYLMLEWLRQKTDHRF